MQKRIDALNEKLEPIIDRMRGYPAFDKVGYDELKAQRLHLQNEIDWLAEIQRSLPLPIESDSYNEDFNRVEIRLTFAPQTIVSPLNKFVYRIDDTRAAGMHVIRVDRMGYDFAYSAEVVGKSPAQMIANQIMHSYTRAAKPLDDMLEGVRFANIALDYFGRLHNHGFGFTATDFKLQHAAGLNNYILRYEGEELEVIDTAVESDDYLKHVKEIAQDYWATARRLIAFTLLDGRYAIDWQPFGMGLATSR